MRSRVALAAVLAGLALAGCPSRLALEPRADDECPGGVCAVPTAPPRVARTYRVRVVAANLPPEANGWDPIGMTHSWRILGGAADIPHKVTLDPILDGDSDWCRLVTVHELGHVVGLDHFATRGGWMHAQAGPDDRLPPGPSPAELLKAQGTSRGLRVALVVDRSLTTMMRDAVRWAAGAWNQALEREVFVLVGE